MDLMTPLSGIVGAGLGVLAMFVALKSNLGAGIVSFLFTGGSSTALLATWLTAPQLGFVWLVGAVVFFGFGLV